MKQKIYLIGLVSFAVVIIGALFKILHYPAAGALMTLGFVALVFIFFPAALINAYRHDGNKSMKPLYIVFYITLLIMFMGMLFKIMHWPGAGWWLLVALPFPFVVFLPVFLVVTSRIKNFSIYKTVTVLLVLTFMSVFNALLALNVSRERLDDSMFLASLYHRTALLKEDNSKVSAIEPEALVISSEKVLDLIKEAKEEFIIATNSESETLLNDPFSMKYPDARNLPTEIMFRGTEPSLGYRLEQSINEFIETIAIIGDKRITTKKAMDLLYFTKDEIDGQSWSERMFIDGWTSWSLVYLGMLENNIILIRDEVLY